MKRTNLNPLSKVLILAAIDAGSQVRSTETKPNIVLILAENIGYGKIGCCGGGINLTVTVPLQED